MEPDNISRTKHLSINKECINIYEILKNCHKELVILDGINHHGNIYGIFMHDIMCFITNILILRNSGDNSSSSIQFPFLSKEFIKKPHLLTFHKNYPLKQNLKVIIKNLLSRKLCGSRGTICINYNDYFAVDRSKLFFELRKQGFELRFVNNMKAYLQHPELQLLDLQYNLKKIFCNLKVKNSNIYIDILLSYIKSKISYKRLNYKCDAFLCGTLSLIQNRIISANLFGNAKVFSICHGKHSSQTLDDPYMGYAEHSYTHFCISYGTKKLPYGNLNQPLFGFKPKILFRGSDNLYMNKEQIHLTRMKDAKPRILYITGSLNDNFRYGPFRDIDDYIYLNILIKVRDHIPFIKFKFHPKNIRKVSNDFPLEDDFKNFVNYDIICLDYFSTAFAEVAATNIPILYFDLGLMNLHTAVKKDFQSRCEIINFKDLKFNGDLVDNALKNILSRSYKPDYSLNFSHSTNYGSEVSVISKYINKYIK